MYRRLVEDGLCKMAVHDLDGKLLSANPAAARGLGYDSIEPAGRQVAEFLSPRSRGLLPLYLERIQKHGQDQGLACLVARDGTHRIWMYANVLHSIDGHGIVLSQALDLREGVAAMPGSRRRYLAAAANRSMKAGESDWIEEVIQRKRLESIALLAGGIAHDFNNFLTIVQNYSHEARSLLRTGDPIDRMLSEVDKACTRAARLASQLLTFGKGGAPVRRPVNLNRMLREACSFALAGSGVRCEIQVSENLSEIEADETQILQVLHNILLNARQAMPEGGFVYVGAADAEILTGHPTLAPGGYARITIRDNGPGITPESLPHVFDPYYSTKGAGRGLGLATAYSIISKHNGRIAVESKPGGGTAFTIELPATMERSPAENTTVISHTGARRVLVMDDEEPIRDVMKRILTRNNCEVQCASEGEEAIHLFRTAFDSARKFDAVFLDLTVPGGLGGKEAVARIRAIDSGVKAVVSSGYADGPVMAEYQRFGFDDVLPKPWTASKVVEVLNRLFTPK